MLRPQIKSFNHESSLLAQSNANRDWYIVIPFWVQNQTPNWNISTPQVGKISYANTIRLYPAELFAATSNLAETYSITVTASFSHVFADPHFPFVCASAFGGGESSLRLRKSPWHQSDKYQDSHLNSPWHTMTEVKSNKVGPTHAANNIARIIYIDTLRESIHLFLRKEIQK